MKSHISTIVFSIWLILLVSCDSPVMPIATITPLPPTATVVPPTITPTRIPVITPTPVPVISLTEVHMFSEATGWAVVSNADSTNSLLHTTDGGQSWTDVTPPHLPANAFVSFFLNAQSAWVYDYHSPTNGLVHTADSGRTWTVFTQSQPIPPGFDGTSITFLDENNGWLEPFSIGTGSAYIGIFATHDGGVTWNQVMLTNHPGQEDVIPGTLHLCAICGDAFFYNPNRLILFFGDLNSDPVGSVHLSYSTDLGKTWKDQTLPLPSTAFAGDNVSPRPPVFFNEKDGLLPFGIIKNNPDMTRAYEGLVVYVTHDGGLTWIPNSTVIGNLDVDNAVDFVSPQDIFAACDNDLCATHNGAHTWQPLHSNLNFGLSCDVCVTKIDFISPTTGWAITTDGSSFSLWKSVNGGTNWKNLSPTLIP